MRKYPSDYNPILLYWEKIKAGEEVVSHKIRKTYQKLVYDIGHPGKWHYSSARANHVIEFFENYLKHSKGAFGGKPVLLDLWEQAHLAAIFGFIDDEGNRKYKRAVLIIGRKNGKSLLSSGVGLYLLAGDGEAGPEIYSAASKRDQAKIVWNESVKMVNKSPALKKRLQPRVAEIRSDFNEGTFKPLASDSNTMDGLNVHGALLDEIHAWQNGRMLYDVIVDGQGMRSQPLTYITTTAGFVREDLYDQIYDEAKMTIDGYFDPNGFVDERSIFFIYELDNRDEWQDENCWKKANPGLGTIKNYDTLKEKVEAAKLDSSKVKNLLTKEFDIPETSGESWLTMEQAVNETTFDLSVLKPRYGIAGVDLSQTTDLTAAKVIFRVPDDPHLYVLQMYWIPEDLVEKHVLEDHVPYDIWIKKGYVRTCPGNKIDYHMVTAWFDEVQNEYDIYLYKVGYDRYSATYWVDEMKDHFGENVMVPVAQGKQTLSDPMYLMKADLDKHLIIYNNHPVDRWCLFNTAVDRDLKNNTIQPRKTSVPTRRIDGTAALLDAYVVYLNNQEEYMSLI